MAKRKPKVEDWETKERRRVMLEDFARRQSLRSALFHGVRVVVLGNDKDGYAPMMIGSEHVRWIEDPRGLTVMFTTMENAHDAARRYIEAAIQRRNASAAD